MILKTSHIPHQRGAELAHHGATLLVQSEAVEGAAIQVMMILEAMMNPLAYLPLSPQVHSAALRRRWMLIGESVLLRCGMTS